MYGSGWPGNEIGQGLHARKDILKMEEKKGSLIARFKRFIDDVALEMRRSSWPDRRTLVSHTVIVIVSVLMLGFFVGISDKIITTLLKLLP
jgi:preprotein translocase SecE subunit